MVVDLKRAFKSLVDDAPWMDAPTKAIAKDKVKKHIRQFTYLNLLTNQDDNFQADAMIQFIGYPDWIKNHTTLDAYYDEYDGVCRFF